MASYKLPLNRLSLGIQEFKYHLDASFFNGVEATEVRSASVEAVVVVDRKSDDVFTLSFEMTGEITIPCDRCLDDMALDVDTTYEVSVKEGDVYDDSDDEVLVIPDTWRELDLTSLMRDTVLLTIPIQHIHPEGECNEQMLARLDEMLADDIADDSDTESGNNSDDTEIDPRWSALKNIKDNN